MKFVRMRHHSLSLPGSVGGRRRWEQLPQLTGWVIIEKGIQDDIANPPASGGTTKIVLEGPASNKEARPGCILPYMSCLDVTACVSLVTIHYNEDIGVEMKGSPHAWSCLPHEINPVLTAYVDASHAVISHHILCWASGRQGPGPVILIYR